MRVLLFAMITALLAGCGSGSGGTAIDPGPTPVAGTASVDIFTQAASAETVVYAVEFVLHLPAGVTVSADSGSGAVTPGVLALADGGALAGAKYVPATATSQAQVKVNIADSGGFTVGNLATLTCTVSAGTTVNKTGFSLDGFVAKDANGAVLPGISSRFAVRTQVNG